MSSRSICLLYQTTSEEATEPIRRVLAWILYLDTVPEAGTNFHWQGHHKEAEQGKLTIFPPGRPTSTGAG